jgi:hypothetical protein
MTRFFMRDDGETEVEIDYTLHGGSAPSGLFGPPEDYDPGSPPEVTVEAVWLVSERDQNEAVTTIELTDAEIERFEAEVIEDPATWEPADDYD